MDYEKKYKEALERAKKYKLKEDLIITHDIFPELAESEDEKIRKALIRFYTGEYGKEVTLDGIPCTRIVAWLEKQKEPTIPDIVEKHWWKMLDGNYALKASEEYRKNRESCGVKDPVMLDEIETAYYAGATLKQKPNPCDGCINHKGCINCENGELRETEQKPAWSKEDERWREAIIDVLINNTHSGEDGANVYSEEISWLKSLRPQNTWKPSDEQIRPLEYAIDYFKKKNNDTVYLESLYNDLKKLKGE